MGIQVVTPDHPDGVGVSALDHILEGHQTMPADRGLFLPVTWRLSPEICAFTSEVFYEGKLRSKPGLERQRLVLARMDRWYGRGGEAEEPAEGPARRPEVRPSEPLEIPALGRESIPAREASAAESLPVPETPAAPPDTEPPPGGP